MTHLLPETSIENELAKVAEQFAREDPESTDQNFPTMVDAYLRPMLAAVSAGSPPPAVEQETVMMKSLKEKDAQPAKVSAKTDGGLR